MHKFELKSEHALRKKLFVCIHQEVEQLENYCVRLLQTCNPDHILKMQLVLTTLSACYEFMQLKRLLLYTTNASSFLSFVPEQVQTRVEQGYENKSQSAVREALVNMVIIITTAAELCSCGATAGMQAAESLLNIAAINRLRVLQQKKPLAEPRVTPPQVSPYALLAQYRLQACLLQANSVSEMEKEVFSGTAAWRNFSATAPLDRDTVKRLAITEIGWQLRQLLTHRLSLFNGKHKHLPQSGYYELVSTCGDVRSIAALISHRNTRGGSLRDTLSILDLLMKIVWFSLRYPESDDGKLSTQLHYGLCLLILCIELEIFADQDRKPGVGEQSRLQSTLCTIKEAFCRETVPLLQHKSPAMYPVVQQSRKDTRELQRIFLHELNSYLERMKSFTARIVNGDNRDYVSADLCMLMHKLAIDLQTLGHHLTYEKAGSLHKVLSIYMEQQWRPEPPLQIALQKFQELLQDTCVTLANARNAKCCDRAVSEITLDPIASEFLLLEVTAQLRCHSQQESMRLPLQLASTIRVLPVAENELLIIFQSVSELTEKWLPLGRKIAVELQLLVQGAHTLKVYRVEALSAVMLELYQQALCCNGTAQEVCCNPRWQSLMLRAHRKLRTMLNQAAAHQEVDSARTIIAALYHWLESRPNFTAVNQQLAGEATEALPAQIAEAAMNKLPYSNKQNLVQRQILLRRRDTAVPAAALQRLAHLTEGCLLSQQRIQRHLHTGNSRSGLVSAQLRELLRVQSETLQLIRQQLFLAQMTNLGQWRGRFERLAGRISNEQNKQVRLQIHGAEIAIEKILLEYLQAALEQILRNAICHGLETTLTRRQSGKAETATITLAAQGTESELVISINDDGAGRVPGNGPGPEIVETLVTTIGGRIEVSSVPEEGSSFRVILPRSQYNGGL